MSASQSTKMSKAYQFVKGESTTHATQSRCGMGKENQSPEAQDNGGKQWSQETPVKPTAVPYGLATSKDLPPSTPATRLPLADLLGQGNDTMKRPSHAVISPAEQIIWVPTASPGDVQPKVTPNRKRKRAKSSSPASSQTDTPNLPLEANTARQTVAPRTPQADPAVDLWNRYAVNANANESTGSKGRVLASLIRDASPKSSATAGSVGGLRRWASCGIEWPTSRSKRRKMKNVIAQRPPDDESYMGDAAKQSRVSELLERMKETLARPHEESPKGPSSSSPLPEIGGTTDATSPLQRLGPIGEGSQWSSQTVHSFKGHDNPVSERGCKISSEYGDIDMGIFDDVALETQPQKQPRTASFRISPGAQVIKASRNGPESLNDHETRRIRRFRVRRRALCGGL